MNIRDIVVIEENKLLYDEIDNEKNLAIIYDLTYEEFCSLYVI